MGERSWGPGREDTQETGLKNQGRAIYFIQGMGVVSQLCYDLSGQEVKWGGGKWKGLKNEGNLGA